MKVALLLSGLARHLDRGLPAIKYSLIDPNNPDIFIHSWSDNQHSEQQILNTFKPVKAVFESKKTFKNSHLNMERMMNSYAKPYQREYFVEAFYSAWYSNLQSNLLKEQHRLQNDIVYDYVIRARFDITYSQQIICSNYNPDVLNTAERGLPPGMIDDRFGFASNKIMNVYCGSFNSLEHIYDLKDKQDGVLCGEVLVSEMCKMYNITHNPIQGLIAHHLNH